MGRRWVCLCVAMACCAGYTALSAIPASAALFRLANGKVLSYQPMKGKVPKAPSRFDQAFSNLDYSGGPVMHANVNDTVVWNPSNYSGTPFQSDSTPSDGYVYGVNQFL